MDKQVATLRARREAHQEAFNDEYTNAKDLTKKGDISDDDITTVEPKWNERSV
jgi:hypothetical protein